VGLLESERVADGADLLDEGLDVPERPVVATAWRDSR